MPKQSTDRIERSGVAGYLTNSRRDSVRMITLVNNRRGDVGAASAYAMIVTGMPWRGTARRDANHQCAQRNVERCRMPRRTSHAPSLHRVKRRRRSRRVAERPGAVIVASPRYGVRQQRAIGRPITVTQRRYSSSTSSKGNRVSRSPCRAFQQDSRRATATMPRAVLSGMPAVCDRLVIGCRSKSLSSHHHRRG